MKYHTEEKQYVVNKEFHSVNIQKVCCVNLITTEKGHTERLWKLLKVKMPMAIHCQYSYYLIFGSMDWDSWSEKKKTCMVVDVLMCLNGMG